MMPFNSLHRFIKYGQVANAKERQKMAEWITDWEPIPLKQANIDARYVNIINAFLEDATINALLTQQPSIQEDLMKELVQLLEQVGKIDTKITANTSEQQLLKQFEIGKGINQDLAIIGKSQYTPDQPWEIAYRSAIKAALQEEDKQRLEQYASLHEEMVIAWQIAREQDHEPLKHLSLKILEPTLLETFKQLTPQQFCDLPENNNFDDFLQKRYAPVVFDTKYFCKQKKIIGKKKEIYNASTIQQVKLEIAQQWQQTLDEERLCKEMEQIDCLRQATLQKLYEKIKAIEELLRQLEPFLGSEGVPGRLWDLSLGNWKRVDMRTLQEYAQLLEQRKDLAELAALLGRFRQAETTLEMETFEETVYYHQEHIDHAGASELVGVVESDELSRLLPSELALFSDEATETIFYKRFLEKRLQTFEYISRVSQEYDEQVQQQRQKKVEEDKGPFILAVDTSGSMHGEPEFIAKVLAFAIAKIALREQRKAYLISFSTTIETLDLSQLQQALPELIRFLQLSFYGGTDAAPAVQEAIRQMKTGKYQKADLLLVSDGIFSTLSTAVQEEVEQLKKAGNRFHALMIGGSYHQQALEFCDQVWQYNPRQDQLLDLVHIMQQSLSPVKEPHNG